MKLIAAILALPILLSSEEAVAPELHGVRYVVRIVYFHDIEGTKPFKDPKSCEPTRSFVQENLGDIDGYQKLALCVPVGALDKATYR